MKLYNIDDVKTFRDAVNRCEGCVWLESADGRVCNLKNEEEQFLGLAALLHGDDSMELYANMREDEGILIDCLASQYERRAKAA